MSGSSKREQLDGAQKENKILQSNLSSFFKSPSRRDVVEAKSTLSSSLMLRCTTQRPAVAALFLHSPA